MIKEFQGSGDFEAWSAAAKWCKEHGLSGGSSCRSGPLGLLFGDYAIAKWHNLTATERNQLHGTLTAHRNGPAIVNIKEQFEYLLSIPQEANE